MRLAPGASLDRQIEVAALGDLADITVNNDDLDQIPQYDVSCSIEIYFMQIMLIWWLYLSNGLPDRAIDFANFQVTIVTERHWDSVSGV